MKNSIFKNFVSLLMFTLIAVSCSTEENENIPLENNSSPPGQVSNVEVTNLAGKSKISYSLPDNPDLLYIKAVYTLDTGRKMEVKSSYYKNQVFIEGYATAGEREVKLYSVNRSEAQSEPVSVTINPQESPLFDVFESLDVGATFGGFYVNANNPERSELAILVMEKDENGDWENTANSIYTSTDEIAQSVRGLDTIPYEFAFTIRDRFLNTSDTIFETITPIFEKELERDEYSEFRLPGDAPADFNTTISRMFDNEYRNWPRIYITDVTYEGPHSFTLDLGQEVKLSRVKIWDYPQGSSAGFQYYYQFNMKLFEIWGSNDPDPDGSYDSWDLLGSYEVKKPSGLPYGQQTDEDVRFASDGFNWEIPVTAPPYRYLRIKNLANWSGGGRLAIAELRVYGDTR